MKDKQKKKREYTPEQIARRNERSKQFYADHREEILEKRRNDPKHQEYMRKYQHERYAMLKELKIPRLTDEQRIEYNLKRKERYANDPEYRAKVKKWNQNTQERVRNKRNKAKEGERCKTKN